MKPVGIVLALAGGAALVGGAALTALLWKELPAAKRYVKMVRM